jgi:DNA-directed RNA polymerase subunit RPC12/RpoP
MIEFQCPECTKKIRVKPEFAGRTGKCPACSTRIVVPTLSKPTEVFSDPVPPSSWPQPKLPAEIVVPSEYVAPVVYPPQPQLSTQTNVQVNIQNSRGTNSLGISSLVLGILSFFVCWVPLIGFSLSGLGLLLGLIGIAMSVFRKGTGIGYSIAGTATNGIALVIGIVFMTMFAGAMASVDKTMKQIEVERNKQVERKPANLTPDNPTIVWHPSSQPLTIGEVTLQITELSIGKVPLKHAIRDQDSESKEELLAIRIRVTNNSKTKKLDYRGWMADFASIAGITAKLTDENDNNYRMVNFSSAVTVKGAKPTESIYPEKFHDDAIVFELPVDGAQKLSLTLSGKGCGQDGEYRFEIPQSQVKR